MQATSTAESRFTGASRRIPSQTIFPPQREVLRHLGFQTLLLPVDTEHQSLGPSRFHQLGFCHKGGVALSTSGQPHSLEDLELQAGDVFFLPSGTRYSVSNVGHDFALVNLATARDGFDITDDAHNEHVLPHASNNVSELKIAEFGDNKVSTGFDMDDDIPHVVLFFENESKWPTEIPSVASLFPKAIIAREFGVPSSSLPDLSVGIDSPAVFRQITDESTVKN